MRKIFLFLILILMSFSVYAMQSAIYMDNQLRVDLIRYSPSLVQPGESFNIWFSLTNTGTEELKDFDIVFVDAFPFSIYSGNSTAHFDSLKVGQTKEISYNILVNQNALEQNQSFTLQYYSKKLIQTIGQTFKINIQRVRLFSEIRFSTEPEEINPGNIGKIKFLIKNPLKSIIKDIMIKLNLTDSSIPFAPVGSTSEKKLPLIAIGDTGEIEFEIAALPNAEAGLYKVPIILEYYDELGRLTTKSDLIGLKIGSIPDLSIILDNQEVYKKGDNGKIVIKFVNKGLSNVKLLNAKLGESKYYTILSNDEFYVGNIDSDDYETADFEISIKGSNWGKIILPLTVNYLDSNNKKYNIQKDVELQIYSSWTAKKLGLIKSSNIGNIFIVLILALIFYLGYRRFKRVNKGSLWDYIKYALFLIKRFLRKLKRIIFRR